MKLAFRLGFVLIPFLFFLSQPAYPQNRLSDLKPASPVVITFTEASRSPASGSESHQRKARLDECSGLASLQTQSTTHLTSPTFAFLSENVKPAAPMSKPYSGNGMGAQATVFHFGE